MTNLKLANNTVKIGRLIAERMPHLEFAIWDLTEFMPAFHNVRKNMIFIETDRIALEEVLNTLGNDPKLGDYRFYLGERKPKTFEIRVTKSPDGKSGQIVSKELNEFIGKRVHITVMPTNKVQEAVVIIARKDFAETIKIEENIRVPKIERRAVDLLAYSLRDWLPISVEEAIDAVIWTLKEDKEVNLPLLQRYATRRYLGWFLDILLLKLEEKGNTNRPALDSRYIENGKRYLQALKQVEEL